MSLLQQANSAYQRQDHAAAIPLYVRAMQQLPDLAPVLRGSLRRAQKAWQLQQTQKHHSGAKPRVMVSGWNLSENPAGRAATLAEIWQDIAEVKLTGFLYPPHKPRLWQPIEGLSLPIQPITIQPDQSFIQQVLDFVLAHPCDLLHLSKPRLPNILLGMLYKLVWACPVWMDVDDEELAFVEASTPLSLDKYLESHQQLPDTPPALWEAPATRLGVGLAQAFDNVTVCNTALQQRYGGHIIRHARDPLLFAPSAERRKRARNKLGIAQKDIVVVFAGTPRAHKGLLETAQAIAQQQRNDLVFLTIGSFPPNQQALQTQIRDILGLRSIMLPDQNFADLPDTLAAGDICVLLQDPTSMAAQYQTPAKLSDALAMGLTVLATPTQGLEDLAAQAAFIPVPPRQMPTALAETLAVHKRYTTATPAAHSVFTSTLSLHANRTALRQLWQADAPQRTAAGHALTSLAQLYTLTAPLLDKASARGLQTCGQQQPVLCAMMGGEGQTDDY